METKEGAGFTAIAYEDGSLVIAGSADYDDKEEAIAFASSRNWDAVVDRQTGKTIWRR